jgi:hypothetical protein
MRLITVAVSDCELTPKTRYVVFTTSRIGTLASVSGPDYFVNKVKDYLRGQGYPDENILTV